MPIPTRNFYLVETDTMPDVKNNNNCMNYESSYSGRKTAIRDRKINRNKYSLYDQVNLNSFVDN